MEAGFRARSWPVLGGAHPLVQLPVAAGCRDRPAL